MKLKHLLTLVLMAVAGSVWAEDVTTFYSADYEDEVADWTTGNADRYLVSIKGDASNHYLSVDAVGTGNNGTTITCNATSGKVSAETDFFMSFDLALAGGNNQASSFYIYDSTNSKAILELTQNAAGNYTAWTVNGSKALNYSAKLAKCTYNIAVKEGTVYFSITDGQTVKYDKEIVATGVSGLGKMVFNTKRYYAGMTIDNVVVRSLKSDDVPAAAAFDYTLTAVDGESNTIKVLTEGSATAPVGYYNPIIIYEGGNYYVANNTSSFANTLSDTDTDVKIVYTLNNNIVAYAEAESSTRSADGNYSNGSIGVVDAQNYTDRGIGLGTLQPGMYQMIVNIVANNARCVTLRNSSFRSEAGVADNRVCEASSMGLNVVDFVLTEETPLLVSGKDATLPKSNQSADFDYVYIVKTADYATATMSVNAEAKYGTFCAPFEVAVPAGVTASTATLDANGETITLTSVGTTIPANTPVVLYAESGLAATTVSGLAVADTPKAGLLTGVYEATEAPANSYVLQKHGEVVGFYKVGETKPTVGANRAYLTVPAGENARFFGFGEETAIKAIDALTAGKAEIFDLQGRRLNSLQKGINIVNGVKILVK